MKIVPSLVACASLLALTPVANACGGHGGGGGGGGGHSGGRSAPACREVSDVVGQQACSRFGSWDASRVPALFVEAGFRGEGIDLSGFSASATATHPDANHPFTLRPGDLSARALGFGASLRIGAYLHRAFYVGGQLGFGIAGLSGAPMRFDGLTETPRDAVRLGLGAFAGVQTHTGPLTLRAEVLAGADLTVISLASRYGACDGNATASSLSPRVEPRLAVEARLAPWTSVGVMAGTNALAPQDWSATLYLRWSLRAYDGAAAP